MQVSPIVSTVHPPLKEKIGPTLFILLGCVIAIYTWFGLTPTSYGVVLEKIGSPGTGLIAGNPQDIRSDEWMVWTPYLQATIRNKFERFNRTSFYNEDMRNVNALPLKDWGLPFKPQLWPFFFLPPENALGFYYALVMCACLGGYYLLFRELGCLETYALTGSLLVFCSGFTQFWWTTVAPGVGFFPWMALLFLKRWPVQWKALLGVYVFAWWFISFPYFALVWTLLLVLLVLFFMSAAKGGLKWHAVVAAISIAVSLVIVNFYFADLLAATVKTVYPGQRRVGPGTVSIPVLLSQFWPFLTFTIGAFRNATGDNICEIATLSSFFPLLTLVCLDGTKLRVWWRDPSNSVNRRALAVAGGMIVIFTLWMTGPCPIWVGQIFVFNRFVGSRMLFAYGLLWLVGCLLIWQWGLVKYTRLRAVAFLAIGPVASLIMKFVSGKFPLDVLFRDIAFAALAALAVGLGMLLTPKNAMRVLVGLVVVLNASFLRFNPLQSATPIFHPPQTALLQSLEARQANTPGHYLAVEELEGGAILNGLGFRSISHVLITPKLDILRGYFPAMDEKSFNQVFNRYQHLLPSGDNMPWNPSFNVVRLPISVFQPIQNVRRITVERPEASTCEGAREGAISGSEKSGANLIVTGWAPWWRESAGQSLRIQSRRNLQSRELQTVQRLDVAQTLLNYNMDKAGFRLELAAADGQPIGIDDVSIIAEGTIHGRSIVHGCSKSSSPN